MTTITKHILLGAAFFGLVSCAQQQNGHKKISNVKVADDYKPTFTATQLKEKFEASFKQTKTDSLRQIFIDWNKTIKPNTDNFMHQNDTVNTLFNVYKEFYKPLDLLKLGKWEWGNNLNSKSKYVVVQNKIFYAVLPTDNLDGFDWEKSKRDSIENFRPPINLEKDKVLYLTSEYSASINNFLGVKPTKAGEENSTNPSLPKEEIKKRYEALRPYIPILQGHWGGYFHLETHPYISIMIFNKTLTQAKIAFRIGHEGGDAILEKNGNTWAIKESKATWIE